MVPNGEKQSKDRPFGEDKQSSESQEIETLHFYGIRKRSKSNRSSCYFPMVLCFRQVSPLFLLHNPTAASWLLTLVTFQIVGSGIPLQKLGCVICLLRVDIFVRLTEIRMLKGINYCM